MVKRRNIPRIPKGGALQLQVGFWEKHLHIESVSDRRYHEVRVLHEKMFYLLDRTTIAIGAIPSLRFFGELVDGAYCEQKVLALEDIDYMIPVGYWTKPKPRK